MSVYGSLGKTPSSPAQYSERRLRARTQLHWTVILFRRQGEAVESVTHNLSSSGFYCTAPVSFRLGEQLICSMKVPTHDPNGKLLERNLECRVRVVRVKPDPDGKFGVACQIEVVTT